MPTRVLIAEDHALVREGTRRILEEHDDLSVVAEASDGKQTIDLAIRTTPDVALLDIRLPEMDGIETTRRLQQIVPQTRILILTAYDDDDYVFALMEAGASGYLLKNARADELVEAVRAVARGEIVLHPAIARKITRLWKSGVSTCRPATRAEELLSPREMEVFRLVAQGLRNKEIAEALHVSVRTVEGHLNNILAKLGVKSRTEAAVYGATHGWLNLPGENHTS